MSPHSHCTLKVEIAAPPAVPAVCVSGCVGDSDLVVH